MNEIQFCISGNPENIFASGGDLSLTRKHYYIGDSLSWEYNAENSIRVSVPFIKTEENDYPFGFNCRIYSEEKSGNVLKFEFGTDGKENLSFLYTLNFVGWKEISLSYERGYMKGEYSKKMNYFQITALEGSGTVYFSEIDLSKPINPNALYSKMAHQIKNLPRPTRRGPVGTIEEYSSELNRPIFPLEKVNAEISRAFEVITEKYFELIDEIDTPPFARGSVEYEKACEEYESYDIKYSEGIITGKNIEKTAIYAKAMKTFASSFCKTGNKEDADKFVLMWRHLKDQDTQINWYYGRGVGSGMLMLKDELSRRGLLSEAIEYLKYAYDYQRIYQTASKDMVTFARYENTDVTGMDLPSTLACLLLMEDSPEKVRDMRHFVYYIEKYCLGFAPGLTSGYKPDGTAFHHCGYIRQYEVVANYSLARVLYMLADTMFMISKEGIDRFKYILKTTFTMYNGVYEPFTVSQYSFDAKRDTSVVEFAHAANAFHDDELKRMYVTLAMCSEKEQRSPYYKKFLDDGIVPIIQKKQHKTLGNIAAAFHSRNDWTVALRGHSKYVYPMEIWPDESGPGARPGMRYSAFSLFRSFGFLEILYPPQYEGGTNNGLHIDKGFDFCRWPGSTAVHVPLSQIKSVPHMVEDERSEWLLSDKGFVGGLDTKDDNGVFAMQLHGPAKYGLDSFNANKTYHYYNDIIVCLGSGISSEIKDFSTETTLFQDFGTGAKKNGNILVDNRGNNYVVFDGEESIVFNTEECISRDSKDYEETVGTRTFAVVNHGIAPKDAHYGYLIKVGKECPQTELDALKNDIRVIKQDNASHIVKLFDTTNYVFFHKEYDIKDKYINSVSQGCIISVTEKENEISLAICDPDLRFYLGESEDYDLNRNKVEKSVYGRFWIAQESMPSRIWVVVNCKIEEIAEIKGNASIIQSYDDKTILEFICKDGLTNEITFSKHK